MPELRNGGDKPPPSLPARPIKFSVPGSDTSHSLKGPVFKVHFSRGTMGGFGTEQVSCKT